MRIRTLALVAALIGMSVLVLAQTVRRDGKWDVKVEMVMPGMQMPATTLTQCVTKEEAADAQKSIPQGPEGRGGPPQNCKMTDHKFEGNKTTFTMTCEPPRAGTMTGEFIYAENSYEGTVKMEMDRSGQPTSMTMKYSGKRLGDCVK